MAKLFDQFGREISSAVKAEARTLYMPSVRDRWATYPSKGLTPSKLASILREADQGYPARQVELFNELEEKDAHLLSQWQMRKNAVLDLEWEIQPENDDPRAKTAADFCREVMEGLEDLDDLLLDLLDAVPQGWAMSELTWDVSAGQAVVAGHRRVPQERTRWDDQGVPRLATDEETVRGIELPPYKVVYHRNRARSGQDVRCGVMRTCCWWWLFKNFSVKDWVVFAEVCGMPLRVGTHPTGMAPDDIDAFKQALYGLGSDGVALISEGAKIDFIEAKTTGAGQLVFERLANFCDAAMSKAVLGQTLTTQVGDKGSYAASKTHDLVRKDLRDADAWALGKTLRQQVLRPLVLFNFGPDAPVPLFKFSLEEAEDLSAKAGTLGELADLGLPIPQSYVYATWGIPQPVGGEAVLTGRAKPVPSERQPNRALLNSLAAGRGTEIMAQAAVDRLTLVSTEEAAQALQGLDADLRQAVLEASSYDDLIQRVGALRPHAGPDLLAEVLERAALVAELDGRASALPGGGR